MEAFPGSLKIAAPANAAKFTFDKNPVGIEKMELKANWHYPGGGKEKVKDNLAGYWLKIFSGGVRDAVSAGVQGQDDLVDLPAGYGLGIISTYWFFQRLQAMFA